MSHSVERDFGVYQFWRAASRRSQIQLTRYYRILDGLEKEGDVPAVYPGSPLIALTLLRDSSCRFLFCDIDSDSISNIKQAAVDVAISSDRLNCVNSDGVAVLGRELRGLDASDRRKIFIHLDPCGGFVAGQYVFDEPFRESTQSSQSPIEFFVEAAAQGCRAMLWYGFDSLGDQHYVRSWTHDAIQSRTGHASTSLWCGEVYLAGIDQPGFTATPGVRGCGILLANVEPDLCLECERLGRLLEESYKEARFPDGQSGQLTFEIVPV